MSKTATLRAIDTYISMLGDVTPSKVHGLGRLSLQGRSSTFSSRFHKNEMLTPGRMESPSVLLSGQRRQIIEVTSVGSTSSEPDDVWQTAIWLTLKSHLPKAPQFIKMPGHREGSLEPDDDVSQTAIWLRAKSDTAWTCVSSGMYHLTGSQGPPDADWDLSLHRDLRLSNLFVFSQPPEQETELTPDEKRYQELNQKYYNRTITEEERLQLGRVEEALDDADAKDSQLMMFNKDLTAGYYKLHNGLRHINKILDELLKE